MNVYQVIAVNRFIINLRDLWIYFCGNRFTPISITRSIFPTIGIKDFGACRKGFKDLS